MLRLNKMTKKSGSSALLIGLNVLLVLLLAGPLAGVAFAGQGKTAVCHRNDEGNYIPISVADPALNTHMSHGDKVVGVDMDANCHPLDGDGDGVQDVADNCVDIANPGQEDRYGSSAGDACEDLDGDGTLDVDETHFCLSIDGVLLESRGLARCISSPSTGADPNVAVSNGDNSGHSYYYGAFAGWYPGYASQPGNGLRSTAIGNSSTAITQYGFNNSAIAIDGGLVQIVYSTSFYDGEVHVLNPGGNNIATAIGQNSHAAMGDASNSTATGITGGRAYVGYSNNATAFAESGGNVYLSGGDNNSGRAENGGQVSVYGNNNSATASGAGSGAFVSGSNSSAAATGAGALAAAAEGSHNRATATGDGAIAEAAGGNNNSATSTGVFTCAGNGDDNEVAVNEDLCNYNN